MKDTKRTAIIGTGGIAHAHARAFKANSDRSSLVAVCDVDHEAARRFGELHGVASVYSDVDSMLDTENLDLVSICTPPSLHTDLSIRAMNSGAWVLCEKPLCASLSELDRIQLSERETGCYTASVFQWRFGSAAQHIRSMFDDGVLGRVFNAVCNTTWYREPAYYEVPWRGTWNSELGGVTMGQGIHLVDLLLWLVGDWTEVKAMVGTLSRDIEMEDVSSALVRFENGAMGTVLNSVLSPRQETYLRMDFERATVETRGLYEVSNEHWSLDRGELSPDGWEDVEKRWLSLEQDEPGGHSQQVAQLLSDMRENRRPAASGGDVRRTHEFVTALYKAAFTNETVRAGSIGPNDPFYQSLHGGRW